MEQLRTSSCLQIVLDALCSPALAQAQPAAHQLVAALWVSLQSSPHTAGSLLQLAAAGPSLGPVIDATQQPVQVGLCSAVLLHLVS